MAGNADRPIGVFDSGVGGLTVLDELLARLPAEDFIYFGDTAWFPYGDKSADDLRARAEAIAGWLLAQDVKMIVVACNTATAAALAHLQTHLDIPVIGVMTAESHAAVQSSRTRRIGLLATEATVASGSYQRMIAAHDAGAEVTAVACPLLAPAIQSGDPFDQSVVDMVREYTQPLRDADVDTVILGCTHYPMVAKLIRRQVPDATLISSGEEIAREIAGVKASPAKAVADGVRTAGKVIATAALIMLSVFAAFIINGDPVIKQFGVGLSAGVLLAGGLTLFMVPAILRLMGRATHWIPKWLNKILPHVDIEGEKLLEKTTEADAAAKTPGT